VPNSAGARMLLSPDSSPSRHAQTESKLMPGPAARRFCLPRALSFMRAIEKVCLFFLYSFSFCERLLCLVGKGGKNRRRGIPFLLRSTTVGRSTRGRCTRGIADRDSPKSLDRPSGRKGGRREEGERGATLGGPSSAKTAAGTTMRARGRRARARGPLKKKIRSLAPAFLPPLVGSS